MVENMAAADRSGPGALTTDELALIDKVREAYRKLSPTPCTSCGYCMPCPNGVNIPRIFELYNNAVMYNDRTIPLYFYNMVLQKEQRADRCNECGQCLEACPQKFPIQEWLQKAHALLDMSAKGKQ